MRRIAVVGSGQVGLLAANALLASGHEVTLHSDRTADEHRHGYRPTGTPALYHESLAFVRALGLDHWESLAPNVTGAYLTFCPDTRHRLVRLRGRTSSPMQAVLPSGRIAMPLGDTSMSMDPIAGQGVNNGVQMVQNLVERIGAHGERPFDAAWMTDTFERFYQRTGRFRWALTDMLLAPLPGSAVELLIAQHGSTGAGDGEKQRLANAFAEIFTDPRGMTDVLRDRRRVRELIGRLTGKPWYVPLATGALGILADQVRQKVGLAAHRP